jgi:hypothetical protein
MLTVTCMFCSQRHPPSDIICHGATVLVCPNIPDRGIAGGDETGLTVLDLDMIGDST